MSRTWRTVDLEGELVFARYLGGHDLDLLQELLLKAAPRWCRSLRVRKSPRNEIPVDLSQPGALSSAVHGAAGERGPTYHAMVQQYGAGPYARFTGSAELRGAGPELTIVVQVDELVVSPLGERKQLGNTIAVQVRRSKVEGQHGPVWLRETMHEWCARLSPAWASARHAGEYWAKVMRDDSTGISAEGRDFGRYLPGVFWINFFGRPYRQLLGEERLKAVPGKFVTEINGGTLVMTSESPTEWDTPEVAELEHRVRDHLGQELFYSKGDPGRRGVVPEWLS